VALATTGKCRSHPLLALAGSNPRQSFVRLAFAVVVVLLGLLVVAFGLSVLVLLTRSPDSDLGNGVLYGGPVVLAGLVALGLGIGLIRAK